ncbi:hypothetical protein [Acetobacter ascendens]|nr:hypothetical protein [Acetobacter ascendens]
MRHESTTTPIISVRGMSKLFGDFVALDRLNFDVRKGEKIVILRRVVS